MVGWLTVECLDGGRGRVYVSPVFNPVLRLAPSFVRAVRRALVCLRHEAIWPKPCPFDIRWTLQRADWPLRGR
jgi:hypothetical protein